MEKTLFYGYRNERLEGYHISKQEWLNYGFHSSTSNEDTPIFFEASIQTGVIENFALENKISLQNLPAVLSLFYKLWIKEKVDLVSEIIQKMIRKYRGFPSHVVQTETIHLLIINGGHSVAACRWQGVMYGKKDIDLFMTYKPTASLTSMLPFRYIITHELMHPISYFYESENLVKREINHNLGPQLATIELFRKQQEKQIQDFIIKTQSKIDIDRLRRVFTIKLSCILDNEGHYFYNIFKDSALTILAMELQDDYYILCALQYEEKTISDFENHLRSYSSLDTKGDNSFKNLLFYIFAINYAPIASVAIGTHNKERFRDGTKNPYYKSKFEDRSLLIIQRYKEAITKYSSPEVLPKILSFFTNYIACIKSQIEYEGIDLNPNQPSVKNRIHKNIELYHDVYKIVVQDINNLSKLVLRN
jgi:hypothetical protein